MRFWIIYILLLVIQPITAICQSRWTNIYYGEKNAAADYFIESYDYGYLIIGRHGGSYPHFDWLIKTDINGQILWEKTIGEPNSYTAFACLANGLNGELYLSGSTTFYDDMQDPIIIKLDSCGEKQWCRVFYTPGNMDYANQVQATDDGGCVVVLMYTGYDPSGNIDRLCLAKFSGEGELLWKQCYNSTDTSLQHPDADQLYMTNDKGFIVSGICHYENPDPPHILYNKPYFLKTDSLGNFQWETVVFKDIGAAERGHGWTTTLNPSGNYYYSSISHYYYNPYSSSPALVKMDLDGDVLGVYDLVNGYTYGGLAWSQFISDTVLAASAGWCNDLDSARQYAVLIDTLGNIINSTLLSSDIYGPKLQVAYDQKLVYMYNTYQNNQFDVYLTKLNYELEDDTLYTYPFQYDTLCPYPIASDTIVLDDCELIVGMEEVKPEKEDKNGEIIIYPNPAQNFINIEYPITNDECRSIISIYDIFGRKVKEIKVPKGQQQLKVDVSNWHNGLYIAVLRNNNKIITKQKFMVLR
jgi:hypothetical protein